MQSNAQLVKGEQYKSEQRSVMMGYCSQGWAVQVRTVQCSVGLFKGAQHKSGSSAVWCGMLKRVQSTSLDSAV